MRSALDRKWLWVILLLPISLFAKEPYKQTSPPRIVHDLAGILSAAEVQQLEQKLLRFNDTTSNQIAILIDKSLEGDDVFEFSLKQARAWGIGQGDRRNGVLIYLAMEERAVFIQVGIGLEPVIPDMLAKRVINNEIVPNFKAGNYYQGLDQATNVLMSLAVKEFTGSDYMNRHSDGEISPMGILIVAIIFIIIMIIAA
ncbi:MAG: TPM domain-containing protein, partial [Bacteroidota bacterium]|nr:TPM domain-containing protein [Bacteroidota bacterium]